MFRFRLFEITRAHPGMYTLDGMEYGYIDNRIYVFSLIMKIEGGIVILRNYSHTGVQLAIPSQFVQCLDNLIRQPRWKPFRPEAPAARAKWALNKLVEERYDIGEFALLDMMNDDESRLRLFTGCRLSDTRETCLENNNWKLLPRAFKRWEPRNTQVEISVGGYRVLFRDNKNRPLIRVVVGKFEVVQNRDPNSHGKNNSDKTPGTANTIEQRANAIPKVKRVSWAPGTKP